MELIGFFKIQQVNSEIKLDTFKLNQQSSQPVKKEQPKQAVNSRTGAKGVRIKLGRIKNNDDSFEKF